jgi:hypothetical protein
LYKDAILKVLLTAFRLTALTVTVLYLCTVSIGWNSNRKYKISCFKVIQKLMWMNLERMKSD